MNKRAIVSTARFIFQFAAAPLLITSTWAKSPAKEESPAIYTSPDGMLVAKVIGVPANDEAFESLIKIISKSGKVICTKDLTSPDHEHGRLVEKASWSPDSQFFVFTSSSSGGHSPWHVPALCYRRHQNKFEALDDYIGSVAGTKFSFRPPNILTINVWKRGLDGGIIWNDGGIDGKGGLPMSVNLGQVFKKGILRGVDPWFP